MEAWEKRTVVSPDAIVRRAVVNGLLSINEALSDAVNDAARIVANDLAESWSAWEGFGSSDMTFAVKATLEAAGLPCGFVGGRLRRLGGA